MSGEKPWYLISLFDKEPYEEWIKQLDELDEFRLVASGGTAKWIEELGVYCETIDQLVGLSYRLNGKVKSLHPDLYTGIMANKPEDIEDSSPFIGGVAVDLTPYREEGKLMPEKVDIGGPSLLRASAKSWEYVYSVATPQAGQFLIENFPLSKDQRRELARQTFRRTLRYDKELLVEFEEGMKPEGIPARLSAPPVDELRYGENPNETASICEDLFTESGLPFEVIGEGNLSYTNCLDMEAARLLTVGEGTESVLIKHTNPTGWATGNDAEQVIQTAWQGDPMSAFGGVVGINRPVTPSMAEVMEEYYVSVLVAPGFESEAIERIQDAGSTRLVKWTGTWDEAPREEFRSFLPGSYLHKIYPESGFSPENWETVTECEPSSDELKALKQMWRISARVSSNAAVLGTVDRVTGVGAGQQSRVDAVEIAVRKHDKYHGSVEGPLVLASDGFFPFADNVELASKAGVDAIVAPGGSVRDDEVINAADKFNMAMVFTGRRVFRH